MGRKLGRTLLELLVIISLTLGLAWTVNARSGKIDVRRNYHLLIPVSAPVNDTPAIPAVGAVDAAAPGGDVHTQKHGWQVISTDDLEALLDDPNTEGGLNVIIDARNAENYAKGHVPYATRIYPYTARDELPPHVERLQEAVKIVVYCGGGECEDSSLMCRELQEVGVAYDRVFLYEGGFSQWEKSKKPVHRGDEP
jgi:rhodanese-related sulfurtransferase